jgi:hypothetical protein
MKHLIISALFCFLMLSCNAPQMNMVDNTMDSKLEQLLKEYPWLAELIEKAETDTTGDYMGNIWIEKQNEQDIFVTNMRMENPRRVFSFFDSEGNPLTIEDSELLTMKFDAPIYSNIPGGEKIEIPDIVDSITACGVKQPQKNLPWLAIMVIKAQADMTGNYAGTVWLEKYKGRDMFVTNMMLGSGGVLYWFFDCSGNHFRSRIGEGYCPSDYVGNHHFFVEDENDFQSFISNMKLDVVIYSTISF